MRFQPGKSDFDAEPRRRGETRGEHICWNRTRPPSPAIFPFLRARFAFGLPLQSKPHLPSPKYFLRVFLSVSASPRLRVKSISSLSNTPRDRPGFLPQVTWAGTWASCSVVRSPSSLLPALELFRKTADKLRSDGSIPPQLCPRLAPGGRPAWAAL